jgi:DNA mismatch endonuclease (patch repair protein)
MARVKGRNTQPELALRKALWAAGLRYRLHRKLPGTPDLAFVSAKVAVFVDGCFWHGCPQHYSFPATRPEFWAAKLDRNVARDARVDAELTALGWNALRLWEHDIKALTSLDSLIERVRTAVLGPTRTPISPPPRLHVAEAIVAYQAPAPRLHPTPWYACTCGSEDTRVTAVSGPGGLSPRSKRPIEAATLLCRNCGAKHQALVRWPM